MMSFIRYYLPEFVSHGMMYYVGHARFYMQQYINNTFSASGITDRIFVGDLASASNCEAMKEQGITHIVSVINGAYKLFPDDFAYMMIHINDDPWVDIGKYFDESNKFIDNALMEKNSKVMIHCQRGVSRSVTLLLAYLLFKINTGNKIQQENVENVINNILQNVQSHRSIADPNSGFITCLRNYVYRINNYVIPISDLNLHSDVKLLPHFDHPVSTIHAVDGNVDPMADVDPKSNEDKDCSKNLFECEGNVKTGEE
jgi:predicted protein tyrosine phosphatase